MKSTGMVRRIDDLGRVVIPMELRRTLGIEEKDALEIFVDGNRMVIQKYAPGCILCDSMDGLKYIRGKLMCSGCVAEIKAVRA